MKKRILSTLLVLCLAVSLLPTAVLAGGTGKGWDAFKADAANPSSNHLALSDYTLFQWPSDAQTLTLAAQLSVRHNGTDNWAIPANITTHFVQSGAISLVSGATLTLNGPVTAAEEINFRPMAVLADGSATVELNNTCFVTRTDGSLGQTYITNNYTWNVNENGALGEVYLTGKLVGKGGTVNTVSVAADGSSAATLGGTLTLTKLNVGLSDSAGASLTIPKGAKITVADSAADKHDGKFYLPAGSTLYLNGELTIETRSNRFNGTIVIGENGKLILKHQYPFTKSNGTEGKITGEGTLQYVHANTYLFENTTDSKLSDINAARNDQSYDERYDDLVAPGVKIERITSGGSGDSSATPSTTLPAPTELAWGRYWYDEDGTQKYFESNGMISWKYPAGVSKTDLALVRVYRVGTGENGGDEQVWHSHWKAAAGKYWTDWDFSLDGIYGETENMGEFTKADYYFTVQMVDQRENPTKVSTEVKSENWHYERPDGCLGTPAASVSESYVVSHTPADVDNDCNGGFNVVVYRSAKRIADPTIFNLFASFMKGNVDRLFAWVRYSGEPSYSDTLNIYELLAGEDPGWCYAVVCTVSSDINAIGHTGDGRVVEFYYKGDSGSGDACRHANTELRGGKDAKCTEAGYTGDTWCKDCKTKIVSGTDTPALGHSWSTDNCAESASCVRTDCNAAREAGSHSFGAWSKKDDTDHVRTCTACQTPETAAHDWNDGAITTPPTETDKGEKTYTCKTEGCGATKTEDVDKLKKQEVKWTVPTVSATYGQTAQVNNNAYNDTVNGGALSYASSNTEVAAVNEQGRVTIVGAGTAIITATAAAVEGYVATSASYTLTVNKAPLTITAKDKTISYGEAPANDGYTVSGLVNSETESVLTGTPAYTYTYEQFGKAGTYAIDLTGLSAKNYDIDFDPGVLTVEKATAYTITLGKLEQVAGYTSSVTAGITPADKTAAFKVEYQVGESWTESVPTESGSYAVRVSLSASDNIAFAADDYTNGTLVVKGGVSVDNGSESGATVGVQVDGGKATLEIEDPAAITGSASGDVKINIGGVSGAKELGLPAGLLTGLSENANAGSLTVTTEDASVKLSGEVLDTVADAVRDGEDSVTVRLTAVEKENLNSEQQAALESITTDAVIVEVKLVISHAGGGETELHELGGDTEITVPYDGPVPAGKYIVVSYVSNDGSVSYVRATYDRAAKQVSFRTNHFSHYVVDVSGTGTFDVTVTDGSGSGTYLAGSTVTVKADSKSGCTFTGWTVTAGTVTLADSTASQTTFTMPEGDVALTANYSRNSSGGGGGSSRPAKPAEPVQPVNPFSDVAAGSYYESAVLWAVEKKITTGIGGGKFGPDLGCTRGQIETYLYRCAVAQGVDVTVGEDTNILSYADALEVPEYAAPAFQWAVGAGIIRGADGKLLPNDTCTRGQIVTMLFRYAAASGMDAVTMQELVSGFGDAESVPGYALPAFNWALAQGIVQGTDGKLLPNDTCTRGQIVTMLYRSVG